MSPEGDLATELGASLDFEKLITEVLATFVNLPPDAVDGAIEDTQRRVCELFDLQLSALWQWAAASPRYLTMTHIYRPLEGPPLPDRIDGEEMYPWTRLEILENREVHFTSLSELPEEAAQDRATLGFFGVRSVLTFPLAAGGGPTLGAVSFASMSAERNWKETDKQRLRLVAKIFAAALDRKRAVLELQASDERLQLAAESAGVGLWEFDPATSTFWLTDLARRQIGIPAGQIVNLERVLQAVAPEHAPVIRAGLANARATGELTRVQYRLESGGDEEQWLASSGRFHQGDARRPDTVLGVTIDITERQQAERALRDMSRRLLRAHEEERARLARELHDDMTQRLALLAIEIGRAELAAAGGPHSDVLAAVRAGLVSLSEDIHSLSYQLHPSILEDLGLAEAIEAECERFARQETPPLKLLLDPIPPGLDRDAALCLFRVAQQALSNVARHAMATSVDVMVKVFEDGVALTVADDGLGFDAARARVQRSLGLESMRERAELVAGTLDIDSAPGQGTVISVWVPCRRTPS